MGFAGKPERDAKLNEKRQIIKNAIKQDLIIDKNILAFFYGGSVARGNSDIYSDLDLRILVKDDAFETYRRNKKERAKHWGEVLYYEDFPWAAHTVAHYKSFVKVDAFYYKQRDLKPSLYLKEEADIIYDPYDIVKKMWESSQELFYTVSIEEFEIWRSKFFAHTHEVYRRVMRNEIYYALHSLDMMRWSVASGWKMEKNKIPNAPGRLVKVRRESFIL